MTPQVDSSERTLRDIAHGISDEVLRAVCKFVDSDGHTIFKPSAFRDLGMPDEAVEHFTRDHVSAHGNYKNTLFVDGARVDSLVGVYGLDVVTGLATGLGWKGTHFFGRGAICRNATEFIEEFVNREKETDDA